MILTYNEERYIKNCVSNIKKVDGIEKAEIIVVDGNSTDGTREMIEDDIKVIVSEPNKSVQMNKALSIAKGKIIWFLHADMKLSSMALMKIKEVISAGYHGGGFSNIFDEHNEKIKRLGRFMNFRIFDKREQSDKGIFYGDNGIFIDRSVLLEIGGVPSQAIMEDYELSVRLKNAGYRMKKIDDTPIVVSARRHIESGFIKTRLQWILIRKLYQWGISPDFLVKLY